MNVESARAEFREVTPNGKVPLINLSLGMHTNNTAMIMCILHRNPQQPTEWSVSTLKTVCPPFAKKSTNLWMKASSAREY